MYQFCFNDCIPKKFDKYTLAVSLRNTLIEYKEVKKKYPEDIDGIITSHPLSEFNLNEDGFSLSDCIASMDKELRIFAYSIFRKYPIQNYFDTINEDNLLKETYTITIAGSSFTAINLVIVSENNGILFTLGLHEDLKKNVLTVSLNTNKIIHINNLFGAKSNTYFIQNLIESSIKNKLGNFEKLLSLLETSSYSSRFYAGFQNIPINVQISILEHVQKAISRRGSSKLFADGSLIKDVTPEKFNYRVFELRIFTPVPLRIYFYEATTKTYLALIEKKPPHKKQDNHINAATSIIEQLILLETTKCGK